MTFGDKLSLVSNVSDSPSESDYTLHHPWDISPRIPTSVPNKLGVHRGVEENKGEKIIPRSWPARCCLMFCSIVGCCARSAETKECTT
jgi:hypothetical protein